MNRTEQEQVMRAYDGELPESQLPLIVRRLDADDEWRGVFDGLAQVGELVRAVAEQGATRADGIADEVMRRIESTPATVYRFPARAVVGGLVAATALAAAVALMVSAGPDSAPLPAQVDSLSAAPAAAIGPAVSPSVGNPAVLAEAAAVPPVAIEAVDFGARNGTIFMVGSGETTVPVVWVVDEPVTTGGRMEPL